MKKSYLFAAALAAGMSFASCSNEENVENVANQPALGVESVGLQGLKSRSGITAKGFSNEETIGLYIYKGAATDLSSVVADYSDGGNVEDLNVGYKLGTDDVTWSPTVLPIVLSSKVGTVYATYPWAEANTNPSAIAISVAEDQGTGQSDGSKLANGQYDYMWATPVSGISNASSKVNLTMNHALAMVTFKFKQTSESTEKYPGVGQVTSIKLYNNSLSTKKPIKTGDATLNIANGVITGAAASANGITVAPEAATLLDVTEAALLPRMLLYPSTNFNANEAQMQFVIDGSTYTLNVPALEDATNAEAGYVAGNNYIYTLTLKGTELVIESVSIKPWTVIDVEVDEPIQTPDQI